MKIYTILVSRIFTKSCENLKGLSKPHTTRILQIHVKTFSISVSRTKLYKVLKNRKYFINICRFLILFDIHLATLFSLKQNNFFIEHKLSPVHLTWLHLVYGKILFQPRHPHLMVSEENSLQHWNSNIPEC